MSVRPWRLEDYGIRFRFGAPAPEPEAAAEVTAAAIEEARLESFDQGYKAGWDDAAKTHQEEQSHISAELARNLQELSFTYYEARQAVLRDAEVLFRGMIDVFLPKILPAAVTATIMERLLDASKTAAEATVEISVAPENVSRLEEMVAGGVAPPLRVCAEPSLGPGQAFLRFGDAEEKVDLQAILSEINAIVDDLFAPETMQEEARDAG